MRPSLAYLSALCIFPLVYADADFWQVRLDQDVDMSRRAGLPAQKYFYESAFSMHYDGRFAAHALNYTEQTKALRDLVRSYLTTFHSLGIETWLMHGTLLGWWWNKQILPWDSDLDVQVRESSMFYLAAYYNMTYYRYRRIGGGRHYLLEINPNYVNREQSDEHNLIDARWIDTVSGLFIDITAVRYNVTHPQGEGMLGSKDGHEYRDTYLYPLRETTFEGVTAKIPYKYKDFLVGEYGEKALTSMDYNYHVFDEDKMQWVKKNPDEEGEPWVERKQKGSRGR